jgi:hypothetical protein
MTRDESKLLVQMHREVVTLGKRLTRMAANCRGCNGTIAGLAHDVWGNTDPGIKIDVDRLKQIEAERERRAKKAAAWSNVRAQVAVAIATLIGGVCAFAGSWLAAWLTR